MEYCLFVEPQQGATYQQLSAAAVLAEQAGFTGFFRSDHYLPIWGRSAPGTTDSWTTLAGIARDTSTIQLGTLVSSATFRHPSVLAIEVSDVASMSGGRVALGLGAGWYQAEHTAFGIPFAAQRFDLFEEQVAVVDALLSTPTDQTVSTPGPLYPLVDAPGLAVEGRRIPLIIGGGGPRRTPALAARYADEYNIFRAPAATDEHLARVREAAESIGRDPDSLRYSAAMQVVVGENRADLERRARLGGFEVEEGMQDPARAVGDVQAVVDRIAEYTEHGIDRVYLQVTDATDVDHLELIARAVLPRLPR